VDGYIYVSGTDVPGTNLVCRKLGPIASVNVSSISIVARQCSVTPGCRSFAVFGSPADMATCLKSGVSPLVPVDHWSDPYMCQGTYVLDGGCPARACRACWLTASGVVRAQGLGAPKFLTQ
jgi:hypothetical protein